MRPSAGPFDPTLGLRAERLPSSATNASPGSVASTTSRVGAAPKTFARSRGQGTTFSYSSNPPANDSVFTVAEEGFVPHNPAIWEPPVGTSGETGSELASVLAERGEILADVHSISPTPANQTWEAGSNGVGSIAHHPTAHVRLGGRVLSRTFDEGSAGAANDNFPSFEFLPDDLETALDLIRTQLNEGQADADHFTTDFSTGQSGRTQGGKDPNHIFPKRRSAALRLATPTYSGAKPFNYDDFLQALESLKSAHNSRQICQNVPHNIQAIVTEFIQSEVRNGVPLKLAISRAQSAIERVLLYPGQKLAPIQANNQGVLTSLKVDGVETLNPSRIQSLASRPVEGSGGVPLVFNPRTGTYVEPPAMDSGSLAKLFSPGRKELDRLGEARADLISKSTQRLNFQDTEALSTQRAALVRGLDLMDHAPTERVARSQLSRRFSGDSSIDAANSTRAQTDAEALRWQQAADAVDTDTGSAADLWHLNGLALRALMEGIQNGDAEVTVDITGVTPYKGYSASRSPSKSVRILKTEIYRQLNLAAARLARLRLKQIDQALSARSPAAQTPP